jgi:predicted nucleotidyltransferase
MTDPAQDRARGVALEAARVWQDAFGARLTAAYLLGSLAHGGYAPAASDIDLGVVLADAREGDRRRADDCATAVRERAGLYGKVSAFWASLPALRDGRDDGRFPALDRLDLADHGQLLLGIDVRETVSRPGRTELLVDSGRFALSVLAVPEVVAEFHHPQRLLTDTVLFTKAVLFPVRFLHATAGDGAPAATTSHSTGTSRSPTRSRRRWCGSRRRYGKGRRSTPTKRCRCWPSCDRCTGTTSTIGSNGCASPAHRTT